MDKMDRAAVAQRKINDLIADLFQGIDPGENGNGDLWFIGALHSPDMGNDEMFTFNTLSLGEAADAARAVHNFFRAEQEAELVRLVDLGFTEAEAKQFGALYYARRHFGADTPPTELLAILDGMNVAQELDELDVARSRVRAIFERMVADATALAMSDAGAWGAVPEVGGNG